MRFYSLQLACLLATVAAAQTCYYPDGKEAKDFEYESCGGGDSHCCALSDGDTCSSNGLCVQDGGVDYYRPACTDKNWTMCENPCAKGLVDDTWVEIRKCKPDRYCCNVDPDDFDCCDEPDMDFFSLHEDDPAGDDDDKKKEDKDRKKNDDDDDDEDGGLSAAEIGAIGGSIGGAALIGIGVAAWWWFMKRNKKQASGKYEEDRAPIVAKTGYDTHGDGDGYEYGSGYHSVGQKKNPNVGYYAYKSPLATQSRETT